MKQDKTGRNWNKRETKLEEKARKGEKTIGKKKKQKKREDM